MGLEEEIRDADGYTEAIRRTLVARALTNVRARGIEPQPEVVAIYAQYSAGLISRHEASRLMAARLDLLHQRAVASLAWGARR